METSQEIYAREIARSVPMTPEEERAAFKRMNALESRAAKILASNVRGRRALLKILASKSMSTVTDEAAKTIRALADGSLQPSAAAEAIWEEDDVRSCFNTAAIRVRKGLAAHEGLSRWGRAFLSVLDELHEARNAFAVRNLRLVAMYANVYRRRARLMTISDLIQEGNSGLMRAIEKFNVSKGVKFSTYSSWWIKQAIRRSISEKDRHIRIPVHLSESIGKYLAVATAYTSRTGERISEEEMVRTMGMTASKVGAIESIQMTSVVPMETPTADYAEILPDQSAVDPFQKLARDQDKRNVERLLEVLSPREREVIRMRFALVGKEEKTLFEIGTMWTLSRERIRQIEAMAMEKLKRHAHRMGLSRSV